MNVSWWPIYAKGKYQYSKYNTPTIKDYDVAMADPFGKEMIK